MAEAESPALLCGDWAWDSLSRELRHYPRRGRKGHAAEPDLVERVPSIRRVSLHRWSQQPMQSATGEMMTAKQCRIVAEYEDGRKLEVNEDDRECAGRLAAAIAESFRVPVEQQGAPSGRRGGNLPKEDEMGRLAFRRGNQEAVLDRIGGTLTVVRRRSLGRKHRRELRTSEIRAVQLDVMVDGPSEVFTVSALVGPEEEKVAVAGFTGLEGWADTSEWEGFSRDLARSLGVEARIGGAGLE